MDAPLNTPLKVAREKRKLTQRNVADAVDIDPTFYGRLENMKAGASAEVAAKLAKFFGHEVTEMQILYPERYVDKDGDTEQSA